jgi:uncharacterized membrane protein
MVPAQLGPKLLRGYLRDHGNQLVLSTFIADFVYCLMVLSHVRAGAHAFVSHLAVDVGVLLAPISL